MLRGLENVLNLEDTQTKQEGGSGLRVERFQLNETKLSFCWRVLDMFTN
jgi:hypothetical protein